MVKRKGIVMKSTGYVRRLDELGRIVLPGKLRSMLSLEDKSEIEMYVDGTEIVMKKYVPACGFCGESAEVKQYKNKTICASCIEQLKNDH